MNSTNLALTKTERSAGNTVGAERKPFEDYYYQNKNNYPALKPAQTVITEGVAEKHFFIHNGLTESLGLLETLKEILQDMQLNSEHYSYDYASAGRLAAKTGKENGLQGADSFFDALDELFPQRGPEEEVPVP
jgi:hypothetical protein